MGKKIKSILELTPKVEEYSITNPENGDEFTVNIRPLTPAEVTELNSRIKRPKPKVKNIHKDPLTGRITEIFDEEDPEYVKELAKANQDFVYLWMVASWEVEIPGDTQDDKIEALRKNVPNWVFIEIQRKLQEVQGYRQSDVAFAKKKSRTTQSDS